MKNAPQTIPPVDLEVKSPEPARAISTTLRKALSILETLGNADYPMSSQQLARAVGLTRSTASRLTLDLAELEYLEAVSDTSRYQLGPAALRLGLAKLSNLDIRKVAAPLMRELSEDSGMPIDMVMPVGEELLYFEISRKVGQITMANELGARMPMDVTAGGHAVLYAMDNSDRGRTLANLRARHKSGWKAIERQIAQSFEQLDSGGFCLMAGAWRPDVSAVAVPFVDPRTSKVFSFTCSAIRLPGSEPVLRSSIGPSLVRLAQRLSATLAGKSPL